MRLSPSSLAAGMAAGIILLLASSAYAFWPQNGRKVISNFPAQAAIPAPDGAGGAYVVFSDRQAPQPGIQNIFIQHVLSSGEVDGSWPVRGKRLTSGLAGQQFPSIYADQSGGWLVFFQDSITAGLPRFRLLRVNSSGTAFGSWPAEGVLATNGAEDLTTNVMNPSFVPDGNGGVFVCWTKQDSTPSGPSDLNIYGWRYQSTGQLDISWGGGPRLLINAAHDQDLVRGTWDGSGGAILVWTDDRVTPGSTQVFATRINASGNVVAPWTSSGAAVMSATGLTTQAMSVISDGAGGAVLGWSSGFTIYGQRLSSTGATLWPSAVTGFPVASSSIVQIHPLMTTDGAGGAVFGWTDYRAGFLSMKAPDIYGARVDAAPSNRYAVDGSVVTADSAIETLTLIAPSLDHGAIYGWSDAKIDENGIHYKIRAQRLNGSGAAQWPGGVDICNTGTAFIPFGVSDGFNGALVTWVDWRDDPDTSLYIARVNSSGVTGPAAVTVSSIVALPSAGGVDLRWSAYMTGAATFQVYRSIQRDGPYAAVGSEIAATSERRDFAYRDNGVEPGTAYYYQLAWREQGDWERSAPVRVVAGAASFALRPVAQNPSRGMLRVEYEMAQKSPARVEVCDLSGRRIRTLFAGSAPTGLSSIGWDGRAEDGRALASGMYFVRLTSGEKRATTRFVWLR